MKKMLKYYFVLIVVCTTIYTSLAQYQQLTNFDDTGNGVPEFHNGRVQVIGDILIFPGNGDNLFRSDGTVEGTYQLYDNDGNVVSRINELTRLNDLIIFAGYNRLTGPTIYRTDGTSEGTVMLTGVYMQSLQCFEKIGDKVFMKASEPGAGEFWVTDGTEEGTINIVDQDGDPINFPCGFIELNGLAYFTADQFDFGQELFVSNGTSAGTYRIKDIYPGKETGYNGSMVEFNNRLFLTANHPDYGRELWTSDGMHDGTQLFLDIKKGIPSSFAHPLLSTEKILFFSADEGILGREIWITDGTSSGTKLLVDVNPGASESAPHFIHPLKDKYITYANKEETGYELRLLDLNGEVSLIKDIREGPRSPNIFNFQLKDNLGFFAADDGINGKELWRTDGTTEGTYLLADINEGAESSNPALMGFTDEGFFFSAETNEYGRELYFMNVPEFISNSKAVDLLHPGLYDKSNLEIQSSKSNDFFSSTKWRDKNAEFHENLSITITPNPSLGESTIQFNLDQQKSVSIDMSDSTGKHMKQLYEDKILFEGIHSLDLSFEGYSNGIYGITITIDGQKITKRIVYMKSN